MTTTTNPGTNGRPGTRPSGLPLVRSGSGQRPVEPPKQRRPALAALALVLIVGGALIAALVAIRMDSRVAMLAAGHDIAPGSKISAADLTKVSVSADSSVPLIRADQEDQILGAYATSEIKGGSLIDQNMLTRSTPLQNGRAIVSVALDPALSPTGVLAGGDLVEVVATSGGQGGDGSTGVAKDITQALVLSISRTSTGGGLGTDSTSSATATLLVPPSAAADVIDASGRQAAGLALLKRDQKLDTPLEAAR